MPSLREALEEIQQRHGYLSAPLLVEEGRDESSPLNKYFVWDDETAGEKYRLDQAARLIRSFKVRYVDSDGAAKSVRQYVNVPRPDGQRGAYEPTAEVLADPISTQILLRQMKREWKAFQARYSHMAEFAELIRSALESEAA